MPQAVARSVIKIRVMEKFESFAMPDKELVEETRLWEDLGLGPTFRKAMAYPFSKISKEYGGYVVRQVETGSLKTVGKAIDLVHKRANRTK